MLCCLIIVQHSYTEVISTNSFSALSFDRRKEQLSACFIVISVRFIQSFTVASIWVSMGKYVHPHACPFLAFCWNRYNFIFLVVRATLKRDITCLHLWNLAACLIMRTRISGHFTLVLRDLLLLYKVFFRHQYVGSLCGISSASFKVFASSRNSLI